MIKLRRIMLSLIIIGIIVLIVVYIAMAVIKPTYDVNKDYDYIIVPGAVVTKDGKPDLMLKQRLDETLKIIKQQPDTTKIIVSGGQGSDEVVSEASAMVNYLIENNISKERIILEDQATSTFENIKFSKALANGNVVIVSQQFHQLRIQLLLNRQHLNWDRAVASNPYFLPLRSYYREPFALVKTIILDWD